jgi:hypothetical protein
VFRQEYCSADPTRWLRTSELNTAVGMRALVRESQGRAGRYTKKVNGCSLPGTQREKRRASGPASHKAGGGRQARPHSPSSSVLRACLVGSPTQKANPKSATVPVTSNLTAYAWSTKCRRKKKLITQFSCKSRDKSFEPN